MASRGIARRLIATMRAPPRQSAFQRPRCLRIPREIAALESMRPFHSTLASSRLVSGLSSCGFLRFEGARRSCSTESSSSDKNEKSFFDEREQLSDTSDGEGSYSESESMWSHDEGEGGGGGDSDQGSEFEEGDTYLNDNDLWDENEGMDETPSSELTEKDTEESKEVEQPSVSDRLMEELARVLPNVPEDAVKKAEEKFRQQQGEAGRVRKEAGAYLRAMKKEYDSRSLVQDEHCKKVHQKLSMLAPDPDGRYRSLMEVVSDIDVLLEAYRRVKAGPGGDPSKVPLDNVSMDWFHNTQAKLRNGTFKLSPIKVVEIEKRELSGIERKRKQYHRFHRKHRQPY
ncbi:uncharacterized protein LOC9642249 [Selaginella moellendorffii]|nr:uncharacterized protein LOC9642249 [Selaginella moellendorffii]|eukprot:XP_002960508.2 uncharacterized protein LOC9642249 [Selaginella moellendorffii]